MIFDLFFDFTNPKYSFRFLFYDVPVVLVEIIVDITTSIIYEMGGKGFFVISLKSVDNIAAKRAKLVKKMGNYIIFSSVT